MVEENITPESIPSEEGGQGAVENAVSLAALLGKELNKEFSDDQAALKAVKDTFGYVGEYGKVRQVMKEKGIGINDLMNKLMSTDQPVAPAATPEVPATVPTNGQYVTKEQFEELQFFAENPEYKPYKDVIEPFRKSNPDKSIAEVIQLDSFKNVYSKVKAHDEAEGSKSVLQSNSRLGAVQDKTEKAQEALKQSRQAAATGDSYGATQAYNSAKSAAVSSVLEAFEK